MKLENLIGKPYKHLGRDLNGFDCYGLVKFCYKTFLNIELPEYFEYAEEWYENDEKVLENKLNEFSSLWHSVEIPIKWDVISFNHCTKNITNHCGLYIEDDKFIHTYSNTPVEIVRLSHRYWNSKISAIMRYNKCQ